jgi:hypothetical protein
MTTHKDMWYQCQLTGCKFEWVEDFLAINHRQAAKDYCRRLAADGILTAGESVKVEVNKYDENDVISEEVKLFTVKTEVSISIEIEEIS